MVAFRDFDYGSRSANHHHRHHHQQQQQQQSLAYVNIRFIS